MRRSVPALAMLVTVCVAPRNASAADLLPLSVERADGAEDCPDAEALVERTTSGGAKRRFVSGPPSSDGTRVAFDRGGTMMRARIMAPGGAVRALEERAPTCDGLAEAVVVALILASDAESAAPRFDAPPPPPPRERSEASAREPAPPAPWLRAAAGGAASIGVVREVAPALLASVHMTPARARWRAGAVATFVPTQTLALGRGSVAVRYLSVAPELCWIATRHLEACGRFEVGWVSGEAAGFTTTEAHDVLRLAAGAAGRGVLPLSGNIGLFAELSALLAARAERFGVDGVGVAYHSLPVGVAVGAGLAVTIP